MTFLLKNIKIIWQYFVQVIFSVKTTLDYKCLGFNYEDFIRFYPCLTTGINGEILEESQEKGIVR